MTLAQLPALRALASHLAAELWDVHVKLVDYGLCDWQHADPTMKRDAVEAHLALLCDLSRPASRDAVARLVAEAMGLKVGATAPSFTSSTGERWYLDHTVCFWLGPDVDPRETGDNIRRVTVPGISAVSDPAEALRLVALATLSSA